MIMITSQMLRDRLTYYGPMSYSDLIALVDGDVLDIVFALGTAMQDGAVKSKFVTHGDGTPTLIYYSGWRGAL